MPRRMQPEVHTATSRREAPVAPWSQAQTARAMSRCPTGPFLRATQRKGISVELNSGLVLANPEVYVQAALWLSPDLLCLFESEPLPGDTYVLADTIFIIFWGGALLMPPKKHLRRARSRREHSIEIAVIGLDRCWALLTDQPRSTSYSALPPTSTEASHAEFQNGMSDKKHRSLLFDIRRWAADSVDRLVQAGAAASMPLLIPLSRGPSAESCEIAADITLKVTPGVRPLHASLSRWHQASHDDNPLHQPLPYNRQSHLD